MAQNALLEILRKQFDESVVPVLRANSVGRELMPVNPTLSGKGLGVLSVETLQYVARASAVTNYDIQNDNYDTVDIKSFPTRIPVQQDDVLIKYRDWKAFQLKNIPLENDLSTDMTANIVVEQDNIIVDGWKPNGANYEIKGMFQVAGNTVEGGDTSTYGNLTKAVTKAISKLKLAGVYSNGYMLSIAPFNYAELDASESANGNPETDRILKVLNRAAPAGSQPGQIVEVPALADGTAMVSPIASQANLRFFDLIETQTPQNNLWYADGNTETGDIKMQQTAALVPRFKHLNKATMTDPCICTITGLGAS